MVVSIVSVFHGVVAVTSSPLLSFLLLLVPLGMPALLSPALMSLTSLLFLLGLLPWAATVFL